MNAPFPGMYGPAVCPDCKAPQCDCYHPIWAYWYRDVDGYISRFPKDDAEAGTRRTMLAERESHQKRTPHIARGPVQRITDPNPFEQEKACADCRLTPCRCQEQCWAVWSESKKECPMWLGTTGGQGPALMIRPMAADIARSNASLSVRLYAPEETKEKAKTQNDVSIDRPTRPGQVLVSNCGVMRWVDAPKPAEIPSIQPVLHAVDAAVDAALGQLGKAIQSAKGEIAVDALARAIWETEPNERGESRVHEFAETVCDDTLRPGRAAWVAEEVDCDRLPRVLDTMWSRDEHGWRSEAEERARAILGAMKK